MIRSVLGAAVVGLVVVGCGGSEVKECAPSCEAGQRCNGTTGICVRDFEPTLEVGALPKPLTTATVTIKGTVSDDVAVVRGEANFQGSSAKPVTLENGALTVELGVPALDSREASVVVRIFDTGDQVAEQTLSTTVDRVGPQVQLGESNPLIGGPTAMLAGLVTDGSGAVAWLEADLGEGATRATIAADGTWSVSVSAPPGLDGDAVMLKVKAADTYGNESETEFPTRVDTRGPTFTLTAPLATVGGTSAVVSGTVTDDSGPVTEATVEFEGSTQTVPVTDGAFTATITFPAAMGQLDGEKRPVVFKAVDRFGNASSSSHDITIDTVGPTLTYTGPTLFGLTGELTGTASDPSAPVTDVTVALPLDGGTGPMPVDSFVNGAWRHAVAFPPGMGGVAQQVTMAARDGLGNPGSAVATITVDTMPPVGAISAPAANARVRGTSVVVSGTVTDDSPVQSVELDFADGQAYRSATVTGTSWSLTVPLSATEANQTHAMKARFTDAVGNSAIVNRSVVVDNVGPAITVTAPTAGAQLGGATTTVAVSATVTDPAGVGAVSVTLAGGAPVTATRQGSSDLWTATVPLPAGKDFATVPLAVTATDVVGNSNTASVNVVVDNVPPVLTITAPTANQVFNISNFTASGNVTISWTVADGDAQAKVTTVGGAAAPATGTSTAWPTQSTDDYRTYSVELVAKDRLNNSTTKTVSFIVDRVAPTVSITPANNTRNVDPRQVTLTFSEEIAASVTNPLTLTPASGGAAGAWQTGRRVYQRTGLDAYKVFTAGVATGVTDRAGNPVAATTSRFHTSAVPATSGTVIATNVWDYDVTTDQDGIPFVAVIIENPTGAFTVKAYRMNPQTGAFVSWGLDWPLGDVNAPDMQAQAWGTIGSDLVLSSRQAVSWRYASQYCKPGQGGQVVCYPAQAAVRATRDSNQSAPIVDVQEPFDKSRVARVVTLGPLPASNAEDGTGGFGYLTDLYYERAPAPVRAIPLAVSRVAEGGNRWSVAGYATDGFRLASYKCGLHFAVGSADCSFGSTAPLTDVPADTPWSRSGTSTSFKPSLAASTDGTCTLFVYYSSTGGHVLRRFVDNRSFPCPIGADCAAAKLQDPLSYGYLRRMSRGPNQEILGVQWVTYSSPIEKTTDCGVTWTTLGQVPGTDPRPLMVGTHYAGMGLVGTNLQLTVFP